jgi:hypothetical protein
MASWNNLDYIDDHYLQTNSKITREHILKAIRCIKEIFESSPHFYIGKTGSPKQRMIGGADIEPINEDLEAFDENANPLNEGLKANEKMLLEKTHRENNYTMMWLLFSSESRTEIEAVEKALLQVFYQKHQKCKNKTEHSRGVMKKSAKVFYIYVVTD